MSDFGVSTDFGEICRRTRKRKPHCNDADSGTCRNPKGRRLPTGGDHGKNEERFYRRQHGQTMVRPLTVLRTGDRKPDTNPYREVGGEGFPSAGASRCLIAA